MVKRFQRAGEVSKNEWEIMFTFDAEFIDFVYM